MTVRSPAATACDPAHGGEVVDEPDLPDPGRHEKAHLALDPVGWNQVDRVDHDGVVGDDALSPAEHFLHRRHHDVRVTLAGADELAPGNERPPQRHRRRSLGRLEATVAAGHGEAVCFSDGRAADDLGGEVEVIDEVLHDHELLVVLLAEEGGARVGEREELCHNGRHAGEVTGSRSALEDIGERAWQDGGARTTRREHLVLGRSKDDPDTRSLAAPEVLVEIARVGAEIAGVTELERVHEDRDGDKAASLPGGVDEGKVATVKRPHRRHEADRLAAGPGLLQGSAEISLCVYDSHVPAATAFSSRASRSAASRSASDTPAS